MADVEHISRKDRSWVPDLSEWAEDIGPSAKTLGSVASAG
jgi:hypothetical protein